MWEPTTYDTGKLTMKQMVEIPSSYGVAQKDIDSFIEPAAPGPGIIEECIFFASFLQRLHHVELVMGLERVFVLW